MDRLSPARDARARQDWQGCVDALVSAGPESDPAVEAERLDLLADAAWWLGRLDDCVDRRERAYALYVETGDLRRAGQCAVWLFEHHCFRASPSIAGAWLRRARRALDGDEDCIEFGALLLREGEVAHGGGDLPAPPISPSVRSPSAAGCGVVTWRPRHCRPTGGSSSIKAGRPRA